MPIEAPLDPAWYLDNVVVPGDLTHNPVGPVRGWQGMWAHEATLLNDLAADPARRQAAGVALRQGFVLTRAQARECGMADAEVRRLLRRSEWESAGHGVVAVTRSRRPRQDALREFPTQARAGLGGGGAATDRSPRLRTERGDRRRAADDVRPGGSHLVTSAPGTFGRRDAVHVRRTDLGRDEADDWFGTPVLPVADAIVETARFDARSGLMAADAALYEHVVSADAITTAIRRAADLPGIRRARQVLQLASELIESPLESITHLALFDSGLPMPRPQRWVRGADGNRYRVDFCWPEHRLILEADGRGKYIGNAGWREKRREITLSRAGFHVVRVVWSDVVDDWPATSSWLAELLGVNPPS